MTKEFRLHLRGEISTLLPPKSTGPLEKAMGQGPVRIPAPCISPHLRNFGSSGSQFLPPASCVRACMRVCTRARAHDVLSAILNPPSRDPRR